jgi:hypothetical protein
MSNQKLGILAVVAAVMVVLAVVQSHKPGPQAGPSGPTYLIQGLDPEQISGITIGTGKNAVKIEKQNDQFVIVNKSNYPADTKQINDVITKCLDIKTSERRTDKAANHADLEVTEDKAHHVIRFLKADHSLLTGVVVGKTVESGQGTFVRRIDSNEVYVTDSAPWFGSAPTDFVKAEIITVKREDVNTVKVTTPEGTYTLKSGKGSDNVVMENPPADKIVKDNDIKSVFQSLVSIRFDDVNSVSDISGLNFDHQYVCRLSNTTEYTLKLAKKDGKTYMQCEATYGDMTPVVINTNRKDTEAERNKNDAKLKAQEFVQKFNLLHKNWVYVIPDWKATYLMKKQADLLEDKPKPAAVPAEPNSPKPAEPNAIVSKPVPTPVKAEPNAPKPAEPNKPS